MCVCVCVCVCCCCCIASVVSDSVRPHRRQPTRLPRPWDSPGKNTGMGCHFLLQCMKVKSQSEVPQSCPTLRNPMDCSLPGSSIHGIFQARVLEWCAIAFSYIYIYISLLHADSPFNSTVNKGIIQELCPQYACLKHNNLKKKKRCFIFGKTWVFKDIYKIVFLTFF